MTRSSAATAAILLLAACGTAGNDAGSLVTVFDTTPDSIVARTDGDVPEDAVRHLVPEVEITAGIDDTSLFTNVHEFDVDVQGRFWVFDQPSASIFVFEQDGTLIRRVGRRGSGPGEFQQNGGMVARADGGIALWDTRNARIAFLDSAGAYTHQWTLSGGFNSSNSLYTDREGTLYLRRPVTPPREGEILGRMGLVRMAEGGAFTDSLEPLDIVVPREEYVASVEGNTSSTGTRYGPTYHWGWLPDGRFVVAHGGKYEMIIVRDGARPLVIRRTLSPVAIDEAERDTERRTITWNLRHTDPDWSWRGPDLPTTKAPMLGILVTRDGRIWAQVAVPSVEIPASEREVPSDTTQPAATHRMPAVYEVFEADGRFLARVALPHRARLIDADGDLVWGIRFDENDLPIIARWRMQP